jgi:hypothetical protein
MTDSNYAANTDNVKKIFILKFQWLFEVIQKNLIRIN